MSDRADQTISVQGREIPYRSARLDVDGLDFYVENPRINYILKTHDGPVSQELVQEKLLMLDSTKDLIQDIEDNGGLIDEILVIGNEVVEGNTRLAAYRRLKARHPECDLWKKIPCKVLPDDVTQEELFFILGTYHIKGKNEWSAYEKAAYVYRMVRKFNVEPKTLGRQLGHTASSIQAMLSAYETMTDKFLVQFDDMPNEFSTQDVLHKYSYFEAFYRQKPLVERADQTPGFVDEFTTWVREGIFPKAECVRQLPIILNNKRASRIFYDTVEEDPVEAYHEATEALKDAKPEKVDPFYIRVREFRDLIQATPPERIREELEQDGPAGKSRKNELRRCYNDLKRFCRYVGLETRE